MDYSNRLSSLTEKKQKLIEEENKLIEMRKKEIAQLAQKFDLLSLSDNIITGLFSYAKKSIADKSDIIKEWETLGGRFQKTSKSKNEKKLSAKT